MWMCVYARFDSEGSCGRAYENSFFGMFGLLVFEQMSDKSYNSQRDGGISLEDVLISNTFEVYLILQLPKILNRQIQNHP